MNRVAAPIDNKNIMEWFTENFHDGDYIEAFEDNVAYQVFGMDGCLCELSYRFGQNWFKISILKGMPHQKRKCQEHINDIILGMNDGNIANDEVIYNPVLGVYEFYYKKEALC